MGFLAEREEVAGVRCLRLMTRACYFIGVGLSTLLTLSAAGRAIAADASLEKRLASATVLQTLSTEGARSCHFMVARDVVVFHLWKEKPDSTIIVAYDFQGHQRFRFGLPNTPEWQTASTFVSDDGSTVEICDEDDHRIIRSRVFDGGGTFRFEFKSQAYSKPSYTGMFFYGAPSIYDRDGREIMRLRSTLSEWSSRFLGDHRLAIAGRDSVYFIEVPTGSILKTVPLGINFTSAFDIPQIRVARADSVIAVYWYHDLVLFSWDGNELWRDHFDDDLYAIAFDTEGPWLALVLGSPGTSPGYISMVSLDKPMKRIRSAPLSFLANNSSRNFEVTWCSRGLITVWGPVDASLGIYRPDMEYSTLFLEFDGDSFSLGEPIIKPGLYRVISSSTDRVMFLQTKERGKVTLLSIETKEGGGK